MLSKAKIFGGRLFHLGPQAPLSSRAHPGGLPPATCTRSPCLIWLELDPEDFLGWNSICCPLVYKWGRAMDSGETEVLVGCSDITGLSMSWNVQFPWDRTICLKGALIAQFLLQKDITSLEQKQTFAFPSTIWTTLAVGPECLKFISQGHQPRTSWLRQSPVFFSLRKQGTRWGHVDGLSDPWHKLVLVLKATLVLGWTCPLGRNSSPKSVTWKTPPMF